MAEVSVELRLVLDSLKADLAKAANAMKAGLGVDMKDQSKNVDVASKSWTKYALAINRASLAIHDLRQAVGSMPILTAPRIQIRGIRNNDGGSGGSGGSGGKGGSGSDEGGGGGGGGGKKPKPKPDPDKNNLSSLVRNIGFLAMPMFNPTSPLAILASFRQGFTGLNSPGGQRMLGSMGLPQGQGAAAAITGVATGAAIALGLSFKGLKAVVHETIAAFENGRKVYARALQTGGMSLSYVVQRGAIANALGISEKEAEQYGTTFYKLAQKFQHSSKIIAETAPNLAKTSWEFSALKQELVATFSIIANSAAPSLRSFARNIREFTVALQTLPSDISDSITRLDEWFKNTLKVPLLGAEFRRSGSSGFRGAGAGGTWDEEDTMPGMSKRMAGSAWERMGLVIGTSGGADYARQTAMNTKRIADALAREARNPGISRDVSGWYNGYHASA